MRVSGSVIVGRRCSEQQPRGSSFFGAGLPSSDEACGASGILNGEAMADISAVLICSSLLKTDIHIKCSDYIG